MGARTRKKTAESSAAPVKKAKRGRPPGSRNKNNTSEESTPATTGVSLFDNPQPSLSILESAAPSFNSEGSSSSNSIASLMNPAPEIPSSMSMAPVSLPSFSGSFDPFQSRSAPTSIAAITNQNQDDSDEDYDAE